MKLLKKLMRIINKKDDMIDYLEQKNVHHQYDKHSIVINGITILDKRYSTKRLVYCMESLFLTSYNAFHVTMYVGTYIFDDRIPSEMFPPNSMFWKRIPSQLKELDRVYVNGYTVMSGHGILS